MRTEPHPSYILHRRPFRETSLILECLSSEHGRVGVVARGAVGGRKRKRAVIQAFQKYQISWSGRSELTSLVNLEPLEQVHRLIGEWLYSGFYINELTMRLTGRHDPNPAVFEVYETTLRHLARHETEVEIVLRRFEKALLDACGYGLQLTSEAASGEEIRPERSYYYVTEQGPLASMGTHQCVPIRGRALLALAGIVEFEADDLLQAKMLMRFVLRTYIGEKPLASRDLFRQPSIPSLN